MVNSRLAGFIRGGAKISPERISPEVKALVGRIQSRRHRWKIVNTRQRRWTRPCSTNLVLRFQPGQLPSLTQSKLHWVSISVIKRLHYLRFTCRQSDYWGVTLTQCRNTRCM